MAVDSVTYPSGSRKCPKCAGGHLPGAKGQKPVDCPNCNGVGHVKVTHVDQ